MTRAVAVWLLSTAVCWTAALAPASASAAPVDPSVQLVALSCARTGYCSAVGGYDDALGESEALLVSESGGRWHGAVQAQPPPGAAASAFKPSEGGGLVGISCPAAGSCVAVGRYTDAGRSDQAAVFTLSHGRWHRGMRLLLPRNAISAPPPRSGVADRLSLASVSCSSPGNCVAVGTYEDDAEVWEAMLVVERRGHWRRAIEAPLPADATVQGQNAALLSVSCAAARPCSAAGEFVDRDGHEQGLLISSNGSRWTAAPAPAAPGDADRDPNMVPSSIACASAGACAAVGTYINPLHNPLGLLLDESGGSWDGATGAVLPPNAAPAGTVGDQTVELSSVACPRAGACTAVGWYFDNEENGQGLIVTQSGGVWQRGTRAQLPANAVQGLQRQSAGLDWISCATPGNCLATGVYTDLGYNSQGLLLSEVHGVWRRGLESPLPRNAARPQYAVASQSDCTAAGACAVIGEYNDRRGDVLGYLLSEHGGRWGHPVELTLPPPDGAELRRSLQAFLTPTGSAAGVARIRASHGYVYRYRTVEAGTAAVSWYATAGSSRTLIAAGRVRVATAGGDDPLQMRLTAAGDKLLAAGGPIHVVAVAVFTPRRHGQPQRATASFTLG